MKKVLVVEDEQTILDIVSFNLEKEGFEVLTPWMGTRAWTWRSTAIPT